LLPVGSTENERTFDGSASRTIVSGGPVLVWIDEKSLRLTEGFTRKRETIIEGGGVGQSSANKARAFGFEKVPDKVQNSSIRAGGGEKARCGKQNSASRPFRKDGCSRGVSWHELARSTRDQRREDCMAAHR